jgi:hypothetical protein
VLAKLHIAGIVLSFAWRDAYATAVVEPDSGFCSARELTRRFSPPAGHRPRLCICGQRKPSNLDIGMDITKRSCEDPASRR